MVLVAITMVVLVGFTAVVVDLGRGYNERRVSQTAADGATLGGIQHIAYGRTIAAQEAMEVARQNLRQQYTDAEWTALWAASAAPDNGCPSTAPSGYTFAPGSPPVTKCVLFSTAGTRMRVRIPDQIIETSFGKVLGKDELETSAWAEAQIEFGGQGGVLPFGVLASGGGGQEICLRDGPGGLAIPPCNGSDSGNFGALDSPLYGNPQYGTTAQCQGNTNGRLVWNIINGIDHPLDEWQGPDEDPQEPGEAVRQDTPTPGCQSVERPNWLTSQPGAGNYLDDALFRSNSPTARLRNTPFQTRRVTGVDVDNRPLWEFIPDTLTTGIPPQCTRAAFTLNATKEQLTTCFDAYNSGSYAPLFTLDTDPDDGVYDIQKSPRFAFIPEYWTNNPNDLEGTEQLGIKRFRSVYIQTIYMDCDGTGCGITFDPGEGGNSALGPPPPIKRAQMMSAMMFSNQMLPETIWRTGPGGSLRGAVIELIQ